MCPKTNPKPNKDKIYLKILQAVITLEFKKGHQKWTITNLSRHSGVTRPLIYYYFGKSRIEILRVAIRVIGNQIFGFNEEEAALWKAGKINEAVLLGRHFISQTPEAIAFYYNHRIRSSELAKEILNLEKKYFHNLNTYFPQTTPGTLKALFAVITGLTITPDIPPESVVHTMNALLRELKLQPESTHSIPATAQTKAPINSAPE